MSLNPEEMKLFAAKANEVSIAIGSLFPKRGILHTQRVYKITRWELLCIRIKSGYLRRRYKALCKWKYLIYNLKGFLKSIIWG